jgi:hypothetical protein
MGPGPQPESNEQIGLAAAKLPTAQLGRRIHRVTVWGGTLSAVDSDRSIACECAGLVHGGVGGEPPAIIVP